MFYEIWSVQNFISLFSFLKNDLFVFVEYFFLMEEKNVFQLLVAI